MATNAGFSTRHVAGDDDPFTSRRVGVVQLGHHRQQGFGARVKGLLVQLIGAAELHDLAEVHHAHPVRHVSHHTGEDSFNDLRIEWPVAVIAHYSSSPDNL